MSLGFMPATMAMAKRLMISSACGPSTWAPGILVLVGDVLLVRNGQEVAVFPLPLEGD